MAYRLALAGVLMISFAVRPSHAADHQLADAVKAQDAVAARALLAKRVDVNGPRPDGTTALHWASHWNDRALAERLLAARANVNAVTDTGITPLALAAVNGSHEMVSVLLSAGANPNLASASGVTPLMEAARSGRVDVVRALLGRAADVNAKETTRGQTALMWAVGENHLEVVRALIAAGADVGVKTPPSTLAGRECCLPNYVGGFTALLFAVQQGSIEAATILLMAGADVNASAADGSSALILAIDGAPVVGERVAKSAIAAHRAHEAMAEFLLERGADPNASGAGRTALHSAVQRKMPGLVKRLLAKGADPNARLAKALPPLSRSIGIQNGLEVTLIGATPFWLASSYADVESMRALLAAGADPHLTSNDGTTPLMVAAGIDFVEGQDKYGVRWFLPNTDPMQVRAIEAVKLCLEQGLDINAANNKGQTPLFGAVYFGGTLLAQFLVAQGANLNAINKRGQTPWLVATKGEYRAGSFYTHKETGELLAQLGADTTLGNDKGRYFERDGATPR